jgi:RNA polymerase sigma-70 factor (ECF subfamily)
VPSADLKPLIQRISAGEHDALAELYDATVVRVYAMAQLVLRNPADAEEVVCEVYTQVWQNPAAYRSERGSVLAWLVMICRSRALDRERRNRARSQRVSLEESDEETPSTQPGPEDILELIQQGTAVHRALEKLTPVRRRLVSLAFFRGMSHIEIAEECGLPVGTVKSHIRRALVTLRAELGEGGTDVASIL